MTIPTDVTVSPTMEPTLSEHELGDCLNAMEMYGLQMSVPANERGPGDWETWKCNSVFAGRLAATVRALLRAHADQAADARRYRWLRKAIITKRDPDRNNCCAYIEIGNAAFSLWDDEPVKLDAAIDAALASARQANKGETRKIRLKTDAEARVHD